MKWYGIISFLFIFFALGGIVYIGANTDKMEINFGEPSPISKQFTAPTNDLPSFDWKLPSFSSSEYISRGEIDVSKIENELRNKLSKAQSPEEIEQIAMEFTADILKSPGVEKECKQILRNLNDEQNKMTEHAESGKELYSYPIVKFQELYKQWTLCSAGFELEIYDKSNWKEFTQFNNP
jgi:hypothetical protein